MIIPGKALLLVSAIGLFGCSKTSEAPIATKRVAMNEKVTPGFRGMPLPVAAWKAQFINPGNRVDVIMVLDKDHPARPKEKSGQTILQNVLVLDVREPLRDGEPNVLELAVNPNEAQWLALAIEEAKIHVVLRGPKDSESHPMEIIGFRKLFR